MFVIEEAAPVTLAAIWDKNIAENPGEPDWVRWKEEYMAMNADGRAKTFLIFHDGQPVGEGTLLFHPSCGAVGGRTQLADGISLANVNALRIEKRFEGMGQVSAMMRAMEDYARRQGCTALTIGVEAAETRNLAIYLHWGYTDFVCWAEEEDTLVLYYRKTI